MADPLLSVRDLRATFDGERGPIRAVDGVKFEVERGETVGLVGESGCGKSTVATTLMGLEESTDGAVAFDGSPVADRDESHGREFRRRVGMVFQDPTSSFDPRMTVGESVAEPLSIHGVGDDARQREVVADLLERVGLAADDVLSSAIDALVAGDREEARHLLADEFETVCERERPTLRETDAGHPAACLRHER